MQTKSLGLPRARYLERVAIDLSQKARLRLRWFDYYRAHGNSAALTCRYFGISRQTFYRWKRRYDPHLLASLEDGSHRPHRRRQATWSGELAERLLRLRQQYPRWGKDKLGVRLRRQGRRVSTSMVGRILTHLKKRGLRGEPLRGGWRVRRPRPPRPWATRKPPDYRIEQPGDLVEVDTMDLRPVPGVVLKPFTARHVQCRRLLPRNSARTHALSPPGHPS